MGVTLKQIADELNVSQPLVTYALNGKPGVSEQMRQRIIETADRLGYHKYSNREARLMAAKRHGRRFATGMIALIFPRHGETPWMSVPYFRAIVDGVEFEVGRRALDLVIAPYRDGEMLPRIVREKAVDGVIFLSDPNESAELSELDLPTIGLSPESPTTVNLVPDDTGGIRAAVEYLIELGHRRIAYLGPGSRVSSALVRAAAYRRTMQEYGLTVDSSFFEIPEDSRQADGAECMRRLLEQTAAQLHTTNGHRASRLPFTSLVCHNDLMAMGAVEVAIAHGIDVPRELSVVGFDDVSLDYHFTPALTSVGFGRFDMGRRAVELICEFTELAVGQETGSNGAGADADKAGDKGRPIVNNFPTILVVRASTAASVWRLMTWIPAMPR
jgi:DNA-binding LacI/PurR family transcriptional regulator